MSIGYHRKPKVPLLPLEDSQKSYQAQKEKLESEETSQDSQPDQKQALVLNEDSSEEDEANNSVIRQFKQEEGDGVMHGFGNLSQLLDGEDEEELDEEQKEEKFNKSQKMPSFLISPREKLEEDEHEISVIRHMAPADQSVDFEYQQIRSASKQNKSPDKFFVNQTNLERNSFLMGLNEVTMDKDAFEQILKDIYVAHKAETDLLKLDLSIHKRIIKQSCDKIRKQQDQIQKLSDTLVLHLMNKQEIKVEKLENKKLKKEITLLEDKIIKMTRLMARYDMDCLQQEKDELHYINMLLEENQTLRGLLKISVKFSGAEKELEEKMKKQEQIMHEKEKERKDNKQGEFAEGYDEDQKLIGKTKQGLTNTVKMKMMERIKQKAENERIKDELKRITEQEFFRYMQ